MIGEIGHFALILALVVAAVQATAPLIGAARGDLALIGLAKPTAYIQFFMVLVAFVLLMVGFAVSDFSIYAVAQHSHTAKPMIYKLAGTWGNHEGSLVLWALMLATCGAAVAALGGNLPRTFHARVVAVLGMIAVGFLAFTLFTSNPFTRIVPAPVEGNGLNPLLQDPALAAHPPFLYLGYVGFSIAFAFAVAALIEGRVDSAWGRWVRPWTLAAWAALTVGIALGSYWAYYELGWGGYWFWDPVENASFMPWLAGTALLHSAIVVERREGLRTWTVLLAIIAFSLSLLGTFLVRSGVLTSVHAFAVDPARGTFILFFLIAVTGGALALYALRAHTLVTPGLFRPVSREGGLVFNNVILAVATGLVLVGTLYPLALEAVTGRKISVGPPYYAATFVPLIVPLLMAMPLGPLLAWKRSRLAQASQVLRWALLATVLLAALSLLAPNAGLGTLLGTALGTWVVTGAIAEWLNRIKPAKGWGTGGALGAALARAKGMPRAAHGMTVAHLGIGVMVLGITAVETLAVERIDRLSIGERIEVAGYTVTLVGAQPADGPNYEAFAARVVVDPPRGADYSLFPEIRTYTQPPMTTTEVALGRHWWGHLFVAVGDPSADNTLGVRVHLKPLVGWIWAGAALMTLGGLISLSDRRLRIGVGARPNAAPPKGLPPSGVPAE